MLPAAARGPDAKRYYSERMGIKANVGEFKPHEALDQEESTHKPVKAVHVDRMVGLQEAMVALRNKLQALPECRAC
jgi:hypothetical protein